jgi:hypothetical protein
VTPPATVAGFTIQYSYDNGSTWGTSNTQNAESCTGYNIRVQYVLTSACGDNLAGTASPCGASQATFRKLDKTNPTASNPGSVNNLKCISEIPGFDITIVTDEQDNCTASPIVTFVGDQNNGGAGTVQSPYVLTRTYKVADECGNSINVTQTFTVKDDVAPVPQKLPWKPLR